MESEMDPHGPKKAEADNHGVDDFEDGEGSN